MNILLQNNSHRFSDSKRARKVNIYKHSKLSQFVVKDYGVLDYGVLLAQIESVNVNSAVFQNVQHINIL